MTKTKTEINKVEEVKIRMSKRGALAGLIIYLTVAFVLLALTEEVSMPDAWHNALLLISGVCLGAFCFYFTVLNLLVMAGRETGTKVDTKPKSDEGLLPTHHDGE